MVELVAPREHREPEQLTPAPSATRTAVLVGSTTWVIHARVSSSLWTRGR